ncbi:hypothetical protein A9Q86_11545 [Flavobacteriales bacterium 33_180_T64]|nr:hypothetical protein A9Q86_11545 [Flavobacteriales bacterium 33_180_T64]
MKLKLTLLIFCLCFLTCKDDAQKKVQLDYKYPSIEKILDCEDIDTSLLQEAFYAFEDDLIRFYTPDKAVYSRAYSLFVSQAVNNKIDYQKMVSEHTKNVFEALKQEKDLWTVNPDGSRVNFKHPVFKCIGANIKDEPLRKTFNALISTNSMSLRMYGDQLKRKTFGMKDDKYLATYIALELYYGKLYDLDLSQPASKITTEKVEKKVPKIEQHSTHDGHNH